MSGEQTIAYYLGLVTQDVLVRQLRSLGQLGEAWRWNGTLADATVIARAGARGIYTVEAGHASFQTAIEAHFCSCCGELGYFCVERFEGDILAVLDWAPIARRELWADVEAHRLH